MKDSGGSGPLTPNPSPGGRGELGAQGAAASSVIAPAVLFEEVELFTIEAEQQTLPIADALHQRADAD